MKNLNNGKYIVNDILGSGGFGITYKITEIKNNRLFALKTLNLQAQSRPDFPELQTKFLNEAIALASCPHPNIVRVYPQVFQEEELWCMVMEYVEGDDLGRYIEKHGKLDEPRAIAIITKIGEALSSIHQKGFLHRDIKPANILLRSSDLEPVLIDFGLAREFISQQSISMTNSRTESFAPIEQYQRHGKFGAWTDVYALAATLYVLVTKELPFPAKFREHAPLIPPQKHNPQVSDRINEAILKGLELQPGDRPQTVKAWLEMLKPPKPKPPEAPKYVDPPTIPVPPKPKSKPKIDLVPPLTRGDGGIESDRNSPILTRRNWLKYSGLAIASMVFALVGKEVIDNSGISEITQSDIELKEYEFDVITINDKGEEINREQGQAKYFTEDLGNEITLEMVEIPGGTFIMGSPEDELERRDSESPQHQVTVPSFYMAKYEVTQAQWKQVAAMPQVERELNPDPSHFKGDNLPVERVSWDEAVEYCTRLSKATGKEYRLPSEAEWEYACRSETTTPFHFGETITTELVNYDGNYTYANAPKGEYRKQTTPVGTFPPNAFGLYDMHGNVWEWCQDAWHDSYIGAPDDGSVWAGKTSGAKVVRGGSWFDFPDFCRSAFRFNFSRVNRVNIIGFRVVCVVPRTT